MLSAPSSRMVSPLRYPFSGMLQAEWPNSSVSPRWDGLGTDPSSDAHLAVQPGRVHDPRCETCRHTGGDGSTWPIRRASHRRRVRGRPIGARFGDRRRNRFPIRRRRRHGLASPLSAAQSHGHEAQAAAGVMVPVRVHGAPRDAPNAGKDHRLPAVPVSLHVGLAHDHEHRRIGGSRWSGCAIANG